MHPAYTTKNVLKATMQSESRATYNTLNENEFNKKFNTIFVNIILINFIFSRYHFEIVVS